MPAIVPDRLDRLVARIASPLAMMSLVAACGGSAATSQDPASSAPPAPPASSMASSMSPDEVLVEDYLPGLAAQVRVPASPGSAPLVVLVPGGGWSSADPTGLVPLAERLTDGGATTSLVTYSTTRSGARFPQPVDDVMCSVRWSAATATRLGHPPSRIVVVGHSAGGHLATLAALSGQEFGGDCGAPPVTVDGVVGLAGVYDTTWSVGALDDFFEGTDTAEGRASGSPLEWARRASSIPPGLRVLLIHGDADGTVPVEQTDILADALRSAGVDLSVQILNGEDHFTVFSPEVAGPILESWLADWP